MCVQYFIDHQKAASGWETSVRFKKPLLDPADLKSYRQISDLSFTSKVVERCACFVTHCEHNHLFPTYRLYRLTETTVRTVHSLVLFRRSFSCTYVSSAFDTIDYGFFITGSQSVPVMLTRTGLTTTRTRNCTVVRPTKELIGKREIRPPVKS